MDLTNADNGDHLFLHIAAKWLASGTDDDMTSFLAEQFALQDGHKRFTLTTGIPLTQQPCVMQNVNKI